jgi:type VI secretion system protein ImpL
MQSFANLRGYLIKINSSVNINKAALEAALQYMQGDTNNPIYKLKLLSNSAPMPVRAWLREIVNNSWQIILDRALIEINSIWNNSIFAEYEAHITSHYPLASQAKAQLDIDNFRQFFGPTGMVSKFFNTYLSSFIDTSESPWKLYVVNGHSLALTRHDVNIFQQIKCIQNLYFSKNSGHPNIELSIKPMLLDNAASHLELTIGSHIIDYAHGPSQPVLINWPLTDSMQQTKLSIINFSTNNAVFSSYGPWSLFKLIAQSRLYPSPAGRGYIATIKLGHYYAKFIIISNTPINAFKLNELKGFSMPSKL